MNPDRLLAACVAALALLLASTATPVAQGVVNPSLIAPLERTADEAQRVERTPASVVERIRDAVVHVVLEVERERDPFEYERPASGVVVSPDGLVVTLDVLVREAFDEGGAPVSGHKASIQLANGERLPVELVARDAATGLALLRAELLEGRKLSAVPFADSAGAAVGEPTVVVSHHDGKDYIVFAGVLSRASGAIRAGEGDTGRSFEAGDVLLTDAAIQTRSHGAALVDSRGHLLGVCDASRVIEQVREPTLEDMKRPSFGFAIPADRVRAVFAEHLGGAAPAAPEGDALASTARAVAKAAAAIVSVRGGDGPLPDLANDDPYAMRRRSGLGSGVVVDPSGLVLTNAHIVDGKERATLTLPGGREIPARVLGSAPAFNAALLQAELAEGETLEAIECASADDVLLGETVLGVGRPLGEALTVSVGVVSAVRQGGRLQADPILGNANGGGALIDVTGRMIGLVDGGRFDKLDVAFLQRGDDMKAETGLSFVPSIDSIRDQFRDKIQARAAEGSSLLDPPMTTAESLEARRTLVTDVVDRTADSLINVYVKYTSRQADVEDNPFAQSEPTIIDRSLGSGVIIDASGLALSNWHVVDDATEPDGSMRPDHVVRARLRDGTEYDVHVLSISREDDLSLLQLVVPEGQELPAIELGSSDRLRLGETVVAVGNPMGRANTITAGVVSAKEQGIRIRNRWAKFEGLIETDAAINSGNSGGPLIDVNGELVGINSAGGGGFAVTGYAIPVDYVRQKTLDVLMSPEKLRSVYLGMTVRDHDGQVLVKDVAEDGPAARAGVEPGDRVVAMDGAPITWSIGFVKQTLQKSPDRPIVLELERGGQATQRSLEPHSAAEWAVLRQTGLETEGIAFRDDPELARAARVAVHRKFTGDPQGAPSMIDGGVVRVVRVDGDLAGEDAQVQVGDLLMAVEMMREGIAGQNYTLQQFSTPADVQRFVNAASTYEGLEFRAWVFRDGEVEVVPLAAKRLML